MKRKFLALVVATIGVGLAGSASAVTLTFDANPTLSNTQAPNTWYTDRYAPAGFVSAAFDGDNRLKHSISAADCDGCRAGFAGTFYNTQGRKYDLPTDTAIQTVQLYVPSSWQSTGRRMAGIWGTAFDSSNAVSFYPIIEFTSDGGTPRFRGYNGNDGTWTDLVTVTAFDKWYTLEIELVAGTPGAFIYRVGNATATFTANDSAYIGNVILQGHNTSTPGVTYDIFWDNFVALPPPKEVSCVGFQSPMNELVSLKKKSNRVLPFKMQLLYDGAVLTDADITPPVIQVMFAGSAVSGDGDDGALLYSGRGDEGNQFLYDGAGIWQFNLNARQFTGVGTYDVIPISGDTLSYTISGCTGSFEIK